MNTKACILLFLMTFFVVSSLSAADTFSYNGIQYMKTPDYGSNTVAVIQGTYSGDIVVPNWATDQSDQSVYEVVAVYQYAFYSCTNLTTVTLGDSIQYIYPNAFAYSAQLTSVNFPSKLVSIGNNAFSNCTALQSVSIPNSMTSLGSAVFSSCTSLDNITVGSLNPLYASNNGLLYNKSVENLLQCPAGKMGEIILPTSVQRISSEAFKGCSKITSVTIPASIDPIGFGGYVFYGCTGLLSIHAKREVPVDLFSATQTFGQVSKSSCTLYVPVGSLTTYSNAYQWKDFFHIVEESTSNLSETATSSMQVQVNGSLLTVSHLRIGQVIRVYNSNGICLFTTTAHDSSLNFQLPTLGLYLVSDGSQTLKVSGN